MICKAIVKCSLTGYQLVIQLVYQLVGNQSVSWSTTKLVVDQSISQSVVG